MENPLAGVADKQVGWEKQAQGPMNSNARRTVPSCIVRDMRWIGFEGQTSRRERIREITYQLHLTGWGTYCWCYGATYRAV